MIFYGRVWGFATTEWQITSLAIAEISVVDQPANPETGFTAIKEAQNE